MLCSARGLWDRTVAIARQSVPEPFLDYPYAQELRIGWYPGRNFFAQGCDPHYLKALPEMTGVVFPYYYDWGVLSHLAINAYQEDGTLHPRRRVQLSAKRPKRGGQCAGIFGLDRLRRRHASLVVTDDELKVCRFPDIVAVSQLSEQVARMLKRATLVLHLHSSDPAWLERMLKLGRAGFQVCVGDTPLVEHVARGIIDVLRADLGLAVATDRSAQLLENLVPGERLEVIDLVRQQTNVDLVHVLPDDFHIYRREGEFYQVVAERLTELVACVAFTPDGFRLSGARGEFVIPFEPIAVGAAVSQLAGVDLDLVDWAYQELKEIPHFYLYRRKELQTRAEVADAVARVVMTILARRAARLS